MRFFSYAGDAAKLGGRTGVDVARGQADTILGSAARQSRSQLLNRRMMLSAGGDLTGRIARESGQAAGRQADAAARVAAATAAKQADDAAKVALKEATSELAEVGARRSAGEGIGASSKKAASFIGKNPKLVIAGLAGAALTGFLIHKFTKNDNVPLKITKIERLSGLLSTSDTICDFYLEMVEGRELPEINDMGAIIIDTLNPDIPQLISEKLNFVKVMNPTTVRIDISQIPNYENIEFENVTGTCTYRTSFEGELINAAKEGSKTIIGGVMDNVADPIIGGFGNALGFNLSSETITIIFVFIVIIILSGILYYTGLVGYMFSSSNKNSDKKSDEFYYYGAGLPSI